MDSLNIKRIIEEHLHLKSGSIDLKTRKREIVYGRQLAHAIVVAIIKMKTYEHKKVSSSDPLKEPWYLTLEKIGNIYGSKDHCTVLHSCTSIRNLCDTDKSVMNDFTTLYKKIFNDGQIFNNNIELNNIDFCEAATFSIVELIKKKTIDHKKKKKMFKDFAFEIYANRDNYSGAKIIELMTEEFTRLF